MMSTWIPSKHKVMAQNFYEETSIVVHVFAVQVPTTTGAASSGRLVHSSVPRASHGLEVYRAPRPRFRQEISGQACIVAESGPGNINCYAWLFLQIGGVLFVGVLLNRALLFGVSIRAPESWKLLQIRTEIESKLG